MTIDYWRARYDHLNAEADRLRARLATAEAKWDALIDEIADAGKKVNALTAQRDAAVRAAKGAE